MPVPADITSKYYITIAEGGWSPCIEGNNAYGLRPFDGSVLPNCVGYAVGRFNEMLMEGDINWLGNTNAENMLAMAIAQGLQTGDQPVVGGVICWSDPNGPGHNAIIEEVISPTRVRTSESGWSYTSAPIVRNYTRIWYEEDQEWIMPGTYVYQGIIYPPHTVLTNDDYYMLFLQNDR